MIWLLQILPSRDHAEEDVLKVVGNCKCGVSLSGSTGFLQIPVKKEKADEFIERIPLGPEGNSWGGRNPSASPTQACNAAGCSSGGRHAARALPPAKKTLQPLLRRSGTPPGDTSLLEQGMQPCSPLG